MTRVESSGGCRHRRRESRVQRRRRAGAGGVRDEDARVVVERGEGVEDAGEVAGLVGVDVVERESREGGGSGVGVHLGAERDGVDASVLGVADATGAVHAGAVDAGADARAVERAERGGDVDGVEGRAVAVDDAEDVLGGARLDREHAVDERGEGVGVGPRIGRR